MLDDDELARIIGAALAPWFPAQPRCASTSPAPLSPLTQFNVRSLILSVWYPQYQGPQDAAGFKTWLQAIGQNVAKASSEGGFLGIGGVQVSDAEKATFADISKALGTSA